MLGVQLVEDARHRAVGLCGCAKVIKSLIPKRGGRLPERDLPLRVKTSRFLAEKLAKSGGDNWFGLVLGV